MRKKIFILLLIVIAGVCQAAIDWDIYSGTEIIENGDEYNDINVYNNATVNMSGGTVDYFVTHDLSSLTVTDGSVRSLRVHEQSTCTIEGGTYISIEPSGDSVFNYSGSAQSTYFVMEGGTSNINGGFVDYIMFLADSNANLYGGEIADFIIAGNSSIVNVYGHDLQKTNTGGTYGFGKITGTWADLTPFDISLNNAEAYSHIVLYEIPEPASILLLSLGGLMLRKNRTRQVKIT